MAAMSGVTWQCNNLARAKPSNVEHALEYSCAQLSPGPFGAPKGSRGQKLKEGGGIKHCGVALKA
jgi:hypothetical protein